MSTQPSPESSFPAWPESVGRMIEQQATGCRSADSYRDYASEHGYTHVEVLNWSSSAGDWEFLVSQDGENWQVLFQTNNYPRPGFSHEISDEIFPGTSEEAAVYFCGG